MSEVKSSQDRERKDSMKNERKGATDRRLNQTNQQASGMRTQTCGRHRHAYKQPVQARLKVACLDMPKSSRLGTPSNVQLRHAYERKPVFVRQLSEHLVHSNVSLTFTFPILDLREFRLNLSVHEFIVPMAHACGRKEGCNNKCKSAYLTRRTYKKKTHSMNITSLSKPTTSLQLFHGVFCFCRFEYQIMQTRGTND